MIPHRTWSIYRAAALILLLLVAGLAINIAVTWACARWGDHWIDRLHEQTDYFGTLPETAAAHVNDPGYAAMFGPDRPTGLTLSTTSTWTCRRLEFTRWHDRRYFAYSRSHTLIRFGFPFRSFEYAERSWFNMAGFPEDGSWRVEGWRGGWPLPPNARTQASWFSGYVRPAHVYPLTPIPLGLLVNTAIYTLLAFSLFRSFVLLRRRTRRRKGLCHRCAYPIGGSPVCTECGTAIPGFSPAA